MRISYVGPSDAVEVPLEDGPTVTVAHGEVQTFPDQIARSLLEQGPEHWRLVSHYGDEPDVERLHGERPSEIARRTLQLLRDQRGLTQTTLSRRLAEDGYPLGQSRLSRLESGERGLSVDDLIALCHTLNVSPLRVLEGSLLPDPPNVAVTRTTTVPMSRLRGWLRGRAPLPPPNSQPTREKRTWAGTFRQTVTDQDWLTMQRHTIGQLAAETQILIDQVIAVRNELPDDARERLADSVDRLHALAAELQDADRNYPTERPLRRDGRGRPGSMLTGRSKGHDPVSASLAVMLDEADDRRDHV